MTRLLLVRHCQARPASARRARGRRLGFATWARLSSPGVYVVTADGVRAAVSRRWDRW